MSSGFCNLTEKQEHCLENAVTEGSATTSSCNSNEKTYLEGLLQERESIGMNPTMELTRRLVNQGKL